jgi:hypothetical protein
MVPAMITKDWRSYTIRNLHQEKILRDHTAVLRRRDLPAVTRARRCIANTTGKEQRGSSANSSSVGARDRQTRKASERQDAPAQADRLAFMLSKVVSELFRVWRTSVGIDKAGLIVISIELVPRVARVDVGMEVPSVLVPSRFVVLPGRGPVAVVSAPDCYRDPLCRLIHLSDALVRDRVNVFEMLLGNHKHVAMIIHPPFWAYESQGRLVFVDDVTLRVVRAFLSANKGAKRAPIAFWCMVKHSGNCRQCRQPTQPRKKGPD